MRSRWITIFWSVMMIAGGVIFFLREAGMIDFNLISTSIWMIIFAILSAFFFLTYFVKGIRSWGWLFPAVILGALALITAIEGTASGDTLSGAIILSAIAVPFLVAFACGRKLNWWALIPAWIMAALAGVILLEDQFSGNLIGTFVLYSIALPFLAIFLIDHSKHWALIPFAAMATIGLIPLLEETVSSDMLGMIIMFLFAIPFYVVYLWSKANWWAIIPAGVFTSIGLTVLVVNLPFAAAHADGFGRAGTALLMAGIGATFGTLWLRRESKPTEWAKYPAIACFVVAVFSFLLGQNLNLLWPVALIAAGVIIIVLGIFNKSITREEKPEENNKSTDI